jgi:hypothetical protein
MQCTVGALRGRVVFSVVASNGTTVRSSRHTENTEWRQYYISGWRLLLKEFLTCRSACKTFVLVWLKKLVLGRCSSCRYCCPSSIAKWFPSPPSSLLSCTAHEFCAERSSDWDQATPPALLSPLGLAALELVCYAATLDSVLLYQDMCWRVLNCACSVFGVAA